MLRGIRVLVPREARSVGATLRKHCPGWFEPDIGRDTIGTNIVDGVRYRAKMIRQRDSARFRMGGKKLKGVYLVNKVKFHSKATADELQLEINLEDIPAGYIQDDMHRILHCKLR
jgi:hypothetical protein